MKNINPCRFRESQVQCVENTIPSAVKVLGAPGDLVVQADCLVRTIKKRNVFQSPFDLRIPIDLIGERLTGNPLNGTVPDSFQNMLNGPGLLTNS